jgi:hypothetical protein
MTLKTTGSVNTGDQIAAGMMGITDCGFDIECQIATVLPLAIMLLN